MRMRALYTGGNEAESLCGEHGGGRRCTELGCGRMARPGGNLCTSHGGGKRCQHEGCTKGARSGGEFCAAHGGGHRCAFDGCNKLTPTQKSEFCVIHGGGQRCGMRGCQKQAAPPSIFCVLHGGAATSSFVNGRQDLLSSTQPAMQLTVNSVQEVSAVAFE